MRDISEITSSLIPTLEGLEEGRLLYRRRQKTYLLILFIPLIALFAGSFLIEARIAGFIATGIWFVVGIILYQVRAASLGKTYVTDYKKAVIPGLLQSIDKSLNYDPGAGISPGAFQDTELFTTSPDRYKTEDLIHGTYGKTFLQLAEINAEERRTRTDSDGKTKTYYVTIFKGLMLIADFHKDFHGRTFVFPDKAEKTFGNVGRFFQKMGGRRETSLIRLEDPGFEEAFAVYSTDEVEARYILSTAMLRRILDLRDRFGKEVRLGFKDSCLTLAVPHNESYLEPNTARPATDTSQIGGMLFELKYFLETIEELDLNTRIWSKK
ncbi:DUF3137 domain-containing protein [Verrucomicrobiales bacterium BCK34]|nr:DUF3137 domain-containing protein [Verrucomicrobiales bacterium BCK34]